MLQVTNDGTKQPTFHSLSVINGRISLQLTGPGLSDLRLAEYELTPEEALRLADSLRKCAGQVKVA